MLKQTVMLAGQTCLWQRARLVIRLYDALAPNSWHRRYQDTASFQHADVNLRIVCAQGTHVFERERGETLGNS